MRHWTYTVLAQCKKVNEISIWWKKHIFVTSTTPGSQNINKSKSET